MKILRYAAFAALALIVFFFVNAVQKARENAKQSVCQAHINQLQRALTIYESSNGHFPPAFVRGPDGTPWHSWRVLLLPYLNEEEVYEQYRFDEPWNGPNNWNLADRINVGYFQCPCGRDHQRTLNTNYVVVVGDETAFPGERSTSLGNITDGPENTLLLVEIGNSDIHWMEPRDLEFDSLAFEPDPAKASSSAISSAHPAGPAVCLADRIGAYRLRQPLSLDKLRALLTIAGGEQITKGSLEKWDGNSGHYLSE